MESRKIRFTPPKKQAVAEVKNVAVGKVRYVTNKEIVGSLCLNTGNGLRGCIYTYVGLIASSFLGFTAAEYSIYTAIILVLSYWDSINDIFIGKYVETHKDVHRFKWYVYVFMVPIMFTSILNWLPLKDYAPGLPGSVKIVYLVVIYIANDIFTTFYNSATNALNARQTPSPWDRGIFSAISSIVSGAIGSIGPFVILVGEALLPNVPEATLYFYCFAVLYMLGTPLVLYNFIVLQERIVMLNDAVRVKWKQIFSDISKNPLIIVVCLASNLLILVGLRYSAQLYLCRGVFAGLKFNLFGFELVLTQASSQIFMAICSFVPSAISMLGTPFIRRYVNDKWLYVFAVGFSALLNFTQYFWMRDAAFYSPRQIFILSCVTWALSGLCNGMFNMCPGLLTLEAYDYGEWKNGRRNEVSTSIVMNWVSRIFNTFSTWFFAQLLVIYRYPTEDYTSIFSTHTVNGVLKLFTLYPGISQLAALLCMIFYPFTGKKRERIYGELTERRKIAPPVSE